MKYLFIHPNFPAQYKHILKVLASKKENQVIFICDPKNIFIPGVRKVEINFSYKPPEKIHRYIASLEKSVYRGQAIWRACHQLKSEGFTPDIVCAHPGWGDALFLKDIFPDTPLLNYLEFYYNAFGADVHFDPRQKVEPDTLARIRIKNANNLINLEACDWGISPTKWRANQNPKEFRQKISVIHEGIDTDLLKPKKIQGLTLPDGTKLKHGDKIITYIARNLEPYRGFPSFMKTVEILNKEHKDCHVIIVGNDGVSYGANQNTEHLLKKLC